MQLLNIHDAEEICYQVYAVLIAQFPLDFNSVTSRMNDLLDSPISL